MSAATNPVQNAIVASEAMKKAMDIARRVAQTDATVLISGESGSGKELIAQTIHSYSLRCTKPWVDVNSGAFPEHLVESELFGYEKGAFSGAESAKPGLLELADKGTLFLDEVGELEPKLQVKLLRVLDGVPYYRVGGIRKVSVNVRILAATNRDLSAAAKAGKFRSDLYYRLNQIHIHVPPLRERPECVVALAEFFALKYNPRIRFSPEVLELFRHYSWPGNVRELKNVITNVCVLSDHLEIRPSDLPVEITESFLAPRPEPRNLEEMQRAMILRVLDQTRGNQGQAAEILGISRRTLYRKIKSFATDMAVPEIAA